MSEACEYLTMAAAWKTQCEEIMAIPGRKNFPIISSELFGAAAASGLTDKEQAHALGLATLYFKARRATWKNQSKHRPSQRKNRPVQLPPEERAKPGRPRKPLPEHAVYDASPFPPCAPMTDADGKVEGVTFSVMPRRDGRCYVRITIPASAPIADTLKDGGRFMPVREGRYVVIRPVEGDDSRFTFPRPTSKINPHHAIETGTGRLGIREAKFAIGLVEARVRGDDILVAIPAECAVEELKTRRKKGDVRPYRPQQDRSRIIGLYGAEATLHIEAKRTARVITTMGVAEVLDFVRGLGREVVQVGGRVFRFDGVTSTIADILAYANQQSIKQGGGPVVLVNN